MDVSIRFSSSDLASLDKVHRWRPRPPAASVKVSAKQSWTHTHSVPWSVLGTIMEKAARSFSQEAPAIAWGVSFGDVKLSQFPHCGLSCSRWRSVLLDYVDAGRQAGQA